MVERLAAARLVLLGLAVAGIAAAAAVAPVGRLVGTAQAATAPSIAEYPLPDSSNGPYPDGITAGPDGNVWFTEQGGDKIGRITPGGVISEFQVPTPFASPTAITAGADGNLWFTIREADEIGRITPSGTVTYFPIPTPDEYPQGIAVGPISPSSRFPLSAAGPPTSSRRP
jgi:streptogramin lyase